MEGTTLFPVLPKNITDLPFYITGLSVEYLEKRIVRSSGYQDYQWSYCQSGCGKFVVENKVYIIEPNTAFFFRKDIPHEYFSIQDPWITKWITFNGSAIESVLSYMNMNNHEVLSLSQKQELDYIMEEIYNVLSLSDNQKHLEASSLLYKLLIKMKIIKDSSSEEETLNLFKKLQPVIALMDENYSRIITLEELADKINVSKHYLCRIFKQAYLVTPFEYLNQLRIQKSKEAIINDKYIKIKQIAYSVGFNDVSYFCSVFKKIEGCTPIEFKKKH